MIYGILKIILYLPLRFLFIRGKVFNNIRQKELNKQGYITVFNHFAFLDIPIVGLYSKRNLLFIGKKELKKNIFVRFVGFLFGIIYLNRDNPDIKSLKKIINSIKKGKVIAIAPEGTRNKTNSNDIQDLKSGVSYICAKADNCYVLPIIVSKKPKLFKKNYINIGKPIKLLHEGEKLNKEMLTVCTKRLKEHMQKCKDELDEILEKEDN